MIKAILFDVGGTLRYRNKINGRNLEIIRALIDFLGADLDPMRFAEILTERGNQYKHWYKTTLISLSEAEIWTKYMLPDFPADFVHQNAVKLNQYWRDSRGSSVLRDDAVSTIRELYRRGYRIGIISNTTSSIEAPQLLRENGLEDCVSTVVLSTLQGRKKPHPSIFYEAAKEIQVPVQQCAYVGNSIRRDVIGSKEAGMGEVVILVAEGSDPEERTAPMKPDHIIGNLSDLLEIYPVLDLPEIDNSITESPLMYDASLSTMWHVGQKMPFQETFEVTRTLGFARIELNHQIPPVMFEQIDFSQFRIGSLHDPCPAAISMNQQKERDWMISSLDEEHRKQGVAIVKRTIDEAFNLHARLVVIHPGSIVADQRMDRELRKKFKTEERSTSGYDELREALVEDRSKYAAPHLDAVIRSMKEIIEYARPTGLMIGLENRYRYYDIPILDEMAALLDLANEEWYGFQYDVGHAQTLDRLGLCNHESWLKRYANRMVGVHLHDVIGIMDHQKPGSGDVDFKMVASYLSEKVYRTMEVSPQLSVEDISAGMETLTQFGCVSRL